MRAAVSAAIFSFAIVAGLAVWNSYARGRKKLLKPQKLEEDSPTAVAVQIADNEPDRRRSSVAELTRKFDKEKSQALSFKQRQNATPIDQKEPSNEEKYTRKITSVVSPLKVKAMFEEKAFKAHAKKNDLNSFLTKCTTNKERASPAPIDEPSVTPVHECANFSNQSDDSQGLSDVSVLKHKETIALPDRVVEENFTTETRPEAHCDPIPTSSQKGKLQQFQRLYPSNGARICIKLSP
uniref:AlNc14C256G9734 protein n=1 Tax=Albugo laibachii Nc14 TaxID=890382 RepID=F0WTR0_9STRA|nr:AlNc14C256G9734 [Albugo laibachii Nc14]|eukprot:CCA24752.1 AlNc14C256G9734 [Albugo laibachii Nc14]